MSERRGAKVSEFISSEYIVHSGLILEDNAIFIQNMYLVQLAFHNKGINFQVVLFSISSSEQYLNKFVF